MTKVVKYELTEEEFNSIKLQLNLIQNSIDKARGELNNVPDAQKSKNEVLCSNELDFINSSLYKVRKHF